MEELPWAKRVLARAHPENATSIRLMQKLGMKPLEDEYFRMPQLGGELTRLVKFGVEKKG